jgi:predicted nucleotidyltransferase
MLDGTAENDTMVTLSGVKIPHEPIAEFCRRHGVKRLSLFGSILRDDFGPDSDIDVLVQFEPECRRHGTTLAQRFNAGNQPPSLIRRG